MENIWIIIGIVVAVIALLVFIQQMVYNGQYKIQQECKHTETMNNIRLMRAEKLKTQALENEVRSLRLQLQCYQENYFKQLQKEIKKEEPIQGIYCRECKNNVSSIACKANVKCKLYEPK